MSRGLQEAGLWILDCIKKVYLIWWRKQKLPATEKWDNLERDKKEKGAGGRLPLDVDWISNHLTEFRKATTAFYL